MSSFNNNNVTLKGAVIIASLVAGGTLTFTRIAVGDGVLPSGQTVLTTEKLVNPLFDVNIVSVESDSVAHATVKGIFSNADLDTGFYYRELGLYAINPVSGAEELFCYGNAGDDAEWINPTGESSLIEKEIHLVTLIGNATTVTAMFDPKTPVLKSEFDAVMPLKADLDDTPENGGRVLAAQMRFDASQTLYVDAAASAGGDGTEAKPFKTIQEAINARYKGAAIIYIKIKAGTYTERAMVPRSANATWRFEREGSGIVSLQGMEVDDCHYVVFDNITFDMPASATAAWCLVIANATNASLKQVTINGQPTKMGISFHSSNARLYDTNINNCDLALSASDSGLIRLHNTGGTNNARGLQASGAIILYSDHNLQAVTPSESYNGGVIIDNEVGVALTKNAYSVLIGENTFRNKALASAMTNSITTLFVEVYADTNDIDKTYTDAASIINSYYDARLHIFEKKDAATVTFYSVVESVTSGNGKAWLFADYTLNGGTIEFAISRDGGTNYTVVTNNQLTDISAKAAGTNMRLRVTMTGAVTLRNVAWGCKA